VRIQALAGSAGSIAFRVEDTGPGIAAADLERVFDPFHSTKSEGAGLGLAICQRIIHEHGGRLGASNGRRGASLNFCLPVSVRAG